MNQTANNATWAERARAVLPAGGFGNFDPSMFIRNGLGSRVWDEDGREYVDYLIGSGPMLLGHGNQEVLDAITDQLPKGMTFFADNCAGVELAEEICRAVARADRFASSPPAVRPTCMRCASRAPIPAATRS